MADPINQQYTNTLEAIRQALGGELPEPGTPAFEQALRRIQRERPELLDALKALRDPSALPPINPAHAATLREFRGAVRRARAVEQAQAWLNRVFGIKDPRRNKTHFNFRLVAVLLGGAVFAAGTLWALWPDLSRALAGLGRPGAAATGVATASSAEPGPASPVRLTQGADPQTLPASTTGAGGGGVIVPATSGGSPAQPDVLLPPTTPLPAGTTPAAGAAGAYPTPSAGTAGGDDPHADEHAAGSGGMSASPLRDRLTPVHQVVPPPPLPEYGAGPAPVTPPDGDGAGAGGQGASTRPASSRGPLALTAAQGAEASRSYAALVAEGGAGAQGGEKGYMALKDPPVERYLGLEAAPRETAGPLALQPASAPQGGHVALGSAAGVAESPLALVPKEEKAEGEGSRDPSAPSSPLAAPTPASPAVPGPSPSPSPGPWPTDDSTGASGLPQPAGVRAQAPAPVAPAAPAAAEYPFEVGEKQQGELVSGVVIPEGSSQAALMVRTKEGYVFFGAASLDRAGRLQIQFDRAYKGKVAYVVRAVALDERGVAGIPAQVSEQAPNLVTNLLRGAASGLVSYIEFYAKSSSTTILPGGGVASSSAPPPLGLTILSGSAKQIAAPPDSTSVVRVWTLEPGTKMQILVVPGDVGGR